MNAAASHPQGWVERVVVLKGRPQPVLLRGLEHAAPGGPAYLPARPLLADDPTGLPAVAVTMMLSRPPDLAETNLAPLIERSVAAFTITLSLPEAVTDSLATAVGQPVTPLFTRGVRFTLDHQRAELQSVEAFGSGASAAFSLSLDQAMTLELLAAIRGEDSALGLSWRIDYRCPDQATTIRLRGSWARLHDLFADSPTDRAGRLTRVQLGDLVRQAMVGGVLVVTPALLPPEQALDAFLRVGGPLLIPRPAGEETRYELRPRLHPAMQLDATLQVQQATCEPIAAWTPLTDVLGGCLDGLDPDRFLKAIAPDQTGQVAPVPRRTRQAVFRDPRAATMIGAGGLAQVGDHTMALTAMANPSVASAPVNAHALLANATAQPQLLVAEKIEYWTIDDLAIGPLTPSKRSLPIVDDPTAPLWRDRFDAAKYWYAPWFTVEVPAATDGPDISPFFFQFQTAGHTASGEAGLEGFVQLRLRVGMRDETRAAWEAAGRPTAVPVPMQGLSVELSVPFRDEAGTTRLESLPAEVSVAGDLITACVALLDNWLRLTYGALAVPGYQSRPAGVRTAFTHEAYVPLHEQRLDMLFADKLAQTQIVPLPMPMPERGPWLKPYLDASTLTYHTRRGAVAFQVEAGALPAFRESPSRGNLAVAALNTAVITETPAIAARIDDGPLIRIRPDLAIKPDIPILVAEREYGVQTLGRQAAADVLFPCATLGGLYVQIVDGQPVAIGCQETFALGQTAFRAYQLMDDPAVASQDFTVWRSLQQPGRFLLVPARYAITRFPASDPGRAYRPAIFLYSTVDAGDPAANRCVVLASVVPDIPRSAYRALERSLAHFAPSPTIRLINEVHASVAYDWPLPTSGDLAVTECRAIKLHDSFQISLACALRDAPQLQTLLQTSGITGLATFTLDDGTAIETRLVLDLNRIIGPAPDGPVACALAAGSCTLTNGIERPVDVSDLHIETASGASEAVPVDRRLAPAEHVTIDVNPAATIAYADAAPAPGAAATITEIRSFVEDVHTNVAFINLINFANHGIEALSLQARLRGIPGTQSLVIDETDPVRELAFVLPLTEYLADPTVEYSVTRVMANGGGPVSSPWLTSSLVAQGNVISLTWDLIQ